MRGTGATIAGMPEHEIGTPEDEMAGSRDAEGTVEASLGIEPQAEVERPLTQPPAFTVLCLYEGDCLNRLWSLIGLGPRRPRHLALRAAVLPLVTWLPIAILTVMTTSAAMSHRINATNFFADFAAYAQFWVGLPLFVLAEAIVSISTRSASAEFAASGVIRPRDLTRASTPCTRDSTGCSAWPGVISRA